MAFSKVKIKKDRLELVSLIDMIFILLVFFLVTSFVMRTPLQETILYIPTPENVLGRAQIVIQIIDKNRVLWLDDSASSIVEQIERNYGYLSETRLRNRIFSALINENILSFSQMQERLTLLCNRADENSFSDYFVLIRCPNEVPFSMVISIISKINDTRYRNIRYGCVGGTLDEIKNSRAIRTAVERYRGKIRKNIIIDF